MDIMSYLLGKKSGGGGGNLSEYFVNSGYVENAGACIKKIPFDIDLTGITNASNFCYQWANLESISIRNGGSVTNVHYMFMGCVKLKFIDVRDIVFSTITSSSNKSGFLGISSNNRVPYDCLIIVKDEIEKQALLDYFVYWTNIKTVEEYENE